MKRLLVLLAMVGIVGPPATAVEFYISPDVPTDDPSLSLPAFLPWDAVQVDSTIPAYSLKLSLPMGTAMDALHQQCDGDWLFSVEAPTELPPGGGVFHEPRDVIRFSPASLSFTLVFCGGPVGIPNGVDVDAAFLLPPGDNGDLVLSFDVPVDLTSIGGTVYEPADLVRFLAAGPGCAGWAPLPVPYFDASLAVPPVPISSNVTGADEHHGQTILTFDVPTDLLAGTTFLPGELVSWNGASFGSFHVDPAWPISSRADALSMPAAPGRVPWLPPDKIHLAKPAGYPPLIRILWKPSTSAGATDYGIYEGHIGTWYGHTLKVCTDTGSDFYEDITPTDPTIDYYYLVVPLNANDEGSYGTDSAGVQRPVGTSTCIPTQSLDCL